MGSANSNLRRGAVTACCLALCLSGCITWTVSGTVPPRVPKAGTAKFLAGAAKADITPIPGLPIGGIGPDAMIARGFWTRLFARAIYMEDADGRPLAMVVCDLPIIPSGLTDRVAMALSQKDGTGGTPDLRHIGLENLILASTETHQGPGNYLTDPMHNSVDTSRAGFDADLFEFLVVRIVEAIETAVANARKAELRIGKTDAENPLKDFFRNRSIEAFLLNPEAEDFMAAAGLPLCAPQTHRQSYLDPRAFHEYFDRRACQAVDARVTVLKLVDPADPAKTTAAAVFLAVHPVVLTVETEVFSGDLFAVAANMLERPGFCPADPNLPMVAIFNGAQGDVSAIYEPRDRKRLLELGERLADHVCTLLASTNQVTDPQINFHYTKIEELRSQYVLNVDGRPDRPPSYQVKTTSAPRPGAAQIAGAEEGRTIFHDLGHHEGLRRFVRDEHGVKSEPGQIDLGGVHVRLGRLSPVEPEQEGIPIGVYSVGDVVLVGMPGEFTTMMGRRIRESVAAKTSVASDRVILIGFANGHTTYVTTPEEYDLQHYEGASGFFGPATGPMFLGRYEKLAASVSTPALAPTPPETRTFYYRTGPRDDHKPRGVGWSPYYVDDGLANIVQNLQTRLPEREFPTFCWQGEVPRLREPVFGPKQCSSAVPDVEIVSVDPPGVVVADNRGNKLDVVTVVAGVTRKEMEWCAIWMAPEKSCTPGECADPVHYPGCATAHECFGDQFQFRVKKIDGVMPPPSAAFRPTDPFLHRPKYENRRPQDEWEEPLEGAEVHRPMVWDPPSLFWCSCLFEWVGLCSGTCSVLDP